MKTKPEKHSEHSYRLIGGIVLLASCLFLAIALFSYNWRDISILHTPPNNPPYNLIGPLGAWLSYILYSLLGVGAYLTPIYCFIFGLILIFDREKCVWPRGTWLGSILLCFVAIIELNSLEWIETCSRLNIVFAGGLFGRLFISGLLIKFLGEVGTYILTISFLIISFVLLIEVRNILKVAKDITNVAFFGIQKIQASIDAHQDSKQRLEKEERQIEKRRKRLEKEIAKKTKKESIIKPKKEEIIPPHVSKPIPLVKKPKPFRKPKPAEPQKTPEETLAALTADSDQPNLNYILPPISLLDPPPPSSQRKIVTDTTTTAKIIIETLAEFGIECEVTNIEQGPVVTSYELLPAAGIRIERINGLSNNLALSLKATSVRVQAPIPGKGVVGIEVPNEVAKMVLLRDILESDEWADEKAALPLVLGQDTSGSNLVADLAKMPHLLIAGATGAGKTVSMNTILTGLLMARTPDEMKLILVDPKIVEFDAYNNLPHLVVPVITNPKKVALGLRWAINEMDRRYKLFAKVKVRNIIGFNSRELQEQGDLFGETEATDKKKIPDKVPYIVIVIDELADIMMADKAETENCIARLAQLSRAVGIHMILSTQRPSVNVITGTIKANVPARIAFQVAQKVDSRTILDNNGADKLLGRGDLLFLPPGTSALVRAQGAMTSDNEIDKVTAFIKEQGKPTYETEILEKIQKKGPVTPDIDSGEDDELLEQAIEIIKQTQRASTSSLQRRLRIGYNRAGRLMDVLESRGIIGPPRGSDPREILIDLDGEIPNNPNSSVEEKE